MTADGCDRPSRASSAQNSPFGVMRTDLVGLNYSNVVGLIGVTWPVSQTGIIAA